jgi:hypothetical protein
MEEEGGQFALQPAQVAQVLHVLPALPGLVVLDTLAKSFAQVQVGNDQQVLLLRAKVPHADPLTP